MNEIRAERPCLACSEPYDAWAPRCPHCNEWFDDAVRAKHGIAPAECIPDDDEYLSPLDWVLGIIFSGIGCAFCLAYLCQNRPKWKKLFLVLVGMQIFWYLVFSTARQGRR